MNDLYYPSIKLGDGDVHISRGNKSEVPWTRLASPGLDVFQLFEAPPGKKPFLV